MVHLGYFATAEEAVLHVARSPEGQEAAQRSAVAPLASEQEVQGAATATRSSRRKAWSRPRRPMRISRRRRWPRPYVPSGAFFKEENAPPMPPDAVVKREREAVVRGGKRSDDGPKRRRSK